MPVQPYQSDYGASYSTRDANPAGNAAVAERLYLSVLGRQPDSYGLADAVSFLDAGNAPAALAARFAASPEYAARIAPLSDEVFVRSAYDAVLGRPADAAEVAFYTDRLAAGTTRAEIATSIAASPEARQVFAATYPTGIEVPDVLALAVARAYDAALGRAPEQAGIDFYRAELASGRLSEQGLSEVLAGSAEFAAVHAGQDNAALVSSLYASALGRQPSSEEVSYYTQQVASGALTRGGLVFAFAAAPEQVNSFSTGSSAGFNEGASSPPPAPTNQAPVVATAPTATVTEDAAVSTASGSLVAGASDPDGGTLSVASVSNSATPGAVAGTYGTLTWAADGSYTYALDNALPATNALNTGATASDTFAFVVSDGQGGTATSNLTVTVNGNTDAVTPGNQPPVVATAPTATVTEDAAVSSASGCLVAGASDPDGGTLSVASVGGSATPGAVAGTYGTLTWAADGSYTYALDNARPATNALNTGTAASDTFGFVVSDGQGGTATSNLTVTVNGNTDAVAPTNQPPAAGAAVGPVAIQENTFGATIGTIGITDPNNDPLTYTFATTPTFWAQDLEIVGTTLKLRDDQEFDLENPAGANVTIVVTGTDPSGASATQNFTVTIGNQNESPFNVALSPSEVAENSAAATVVGALSAGDVDAGDTLTFTVSGNPNFAVDAATNNLVVAPGATLDFETTPSQTITVTATDAAGATANQVVTVTLTDVAEGGGGTPVAAVAATDNYTTTLNTQRVEPAAAGLLANDAGDAPLTATIETLTGTGGGTLDIAADGSFTYTPSTGFTGTDNFTYTLNDANETVQGTASFGVA